MTFNGGQTENGNTRIHRKQDIHDYFSKQENSDKYCLINISNFFKINSNIVIMILSLLTIEPLITHRSVFLKLGSAEVILGGLSSQVGETSTDFKTSQKYTC